MNTRTLLTTIAATIAMLASIALAQEGYTAYAVADIVASEDSDAVMVECIDGVAEAMSGFDDFACYNTFGSTDLVRAKINNTIADFGDVQWMQAWERSDQVENRTMLAEWGDIYVFWLLSMDDHDTLVIVSRLKE